MPYRISHVPYTVLPRYTWQAGAKKRLAPLRQLRPTATLDGTTCLITEARRKTCAHVDVCRRCSFEDVRVKCVRHQRRVHEYRHVVLLFLPRRVVWQRDRRLQQNGCFK